MTEIKIDIFDNLASIFFVIYLYNEQNYNLGNYKVFFKKVFHLILSKIWVEKQIYII